MNTSIRIRKLEDKISNKLDKRLSLWPLLGGLSSHAPGEDIPDRPSRPITQQEAEILKNKGLPIPICIDLSREEEFQEYLKT